MTEDSNELPADVQTNHFEGPATKEDWLQAQELDADPAEVARLIAKERLARGAAAAALEHAEKSRIDILSGLVNNNTYIYEFDKLLRQLNNEQPRRAGYPDGAFQFMFDIRKMHEINNRQGGQVKGDKTITTVGNLLKDTFRMDDGDIVARTGGDEFTVVTPYLLVDADGNKRTPDDIKALLWKRLTSNWLKLDVEGAKPDFDLLVHFAPVELGRSREDTRKKADPKNNWDQAMVFGQTIEPYHQVEKREQSQPQRQNHFKRIFKRRHYVH
jgi:GGDEF domain-containing protein